METEALSRDDKPESEGCVLYVGVGPEGCVGRSLALHAGTALIGNAPECQLVLEDATVSRRHAEIVVKADGIEVRDLGSRNGIWSVGQRLELARLKAGSRFFVGRCGIDILPLGTAVRAIPPSPQRSYGELVGEAIAMRRLYTILERLEHSDAPVLIGGETGTGKEVVARAIHNRSARASQPYVVIDCGSIQPELIRSEMFGHKKGAFTGADVDRAGAFETASGGTVFLDEVGELPLPLQPALLRVLETNQIQRIGESTPRPINVRVIAATHRKLADEVREGRFRQDLYYRIAVVTLNVPSLRERIDDVPLLAAHFLSKLATRAVPPLSPAIVTRLVAHDWPGNVRELRNAIARWLAIGVLELGGEADGDLEDVGPAAALEGEPPLRPFKDMREEAIAMFEKRYLERLLATVSDNLSEAARIAKIDRKYLRELLKKHDLRSPDERC